jgi:hypothetical protein
MKDAGLRRRRSDEAFTCCAQKNKGTATAGTEDLLRWPSGKGTALMVVLQE